jgi:NOL1/NOP2/fmu family ribosome biogenesis protein
MKSSALLGSAAQLKVSRVGLKAFHKVGAFIKPTTRIIQMFGHAAKKARLEIDGKQLQRLVSNQDLPVDLNLDKGYVILTLEGDIILGLGFYGHGKVKSQIPRKELRRAMLDLI